jgi:hypothetical protein
VSDPRRPPPTYDDFVLILIAFVVMLAILWTAAGGRMTVAP